VLRFPAVPARNIKGRGRILRNRNRSWSTRKNRFVIFQCGSSVGIGTWITQLPNFLPQPRDLLLDQINRRMTRADDASVA
jgi:hypothetical protein